MSPTPRPSCTRRPRSQRDEFAASAGGSKNVLPEFAVKDVLSEFAANTAAPGAEGDGVELEHDEPHRAVRSGLRGQVDPGRVGHGAAVDDNAAESMRHRKLQTWERCRHERDWARADTCSCSTAPACAAPTGQARPIPRGWCGSAANLGSGGPSRHGSHVMAPNALGVLVELEACGQPARHRHHRGGAQRLAPRPSFVRLLWRSARGSWCVAAVRC